MDRSDEVSEGRTLHSWKEIANCLGVTVRSVQRWEQSAGLPVYRQGSGSKARVFAYSDELLSWRQRRSEQGADPDLAAPNPAGPGEDEAAAPTPRPRRVGYGLFVVLAVLLAAAGAAAWRAGIFPRRPPADWLIERSTLKVLDEGGRVLWEKRFPALSRTVDAENIDRALIEDIDGDGRKEVLLNHIPGNPAAMDGSLMCFDGNGRLRWETRYGAPRTIGDRTFSQSYKGRFVRLVNVAGKPRLLTVASHYLWYPTQVALIDPGTGRILEDYWHPGVVYFCLLRDLDRDGRDEVLLGAINNPGSGLGHAGVAVLKIPFSSGPARVPATGAPFPPMIGGREFAYLLFPVPDVSKVMGVLPIMSQMAIDQNDRIIVQTPTPEGGIVYYMDFNLVVQECRFSDGFAPLHNRMNRQGLLDHALTGRESAALAKVVRLPSAPDGNNPELERLWDSGRR